MELIDLSYQIDNNMPVYPGDIQTNLFQTSFLDVSHYNTFRLESCMHSGTHIDSPMHLGCGNKFISDIALESFVASGCILDVRGQQVIAMKNVYKSLIKPDSAVLLFTGYSSYYGTQKYYDDYPCVDEDFGRFLAAKNIKMLGMDMPSPDKYPFEIHKMLFRNGVCIIENLTNLEQLLTVDNFEILALPLKIKADSSLVRAVARIV
jgi:kynurenine formamidase